MRTLTELIIELSQQQRAGVKAPLPVQVVTYNRDGQPVYLNITGVSTLKEPQVKVLISAEVVGL